MTLFFLYKLKNDSKLTESKNVARGQNLFSNMALEKKV